MRDNGAAIKLLDTWLADESGYDERVWPIIKEMIEENRMSNRRRFCDDEKLQERTITNLKVICNKLLDKYRVV